jgi:deoxyribonuclease V
MKPALLHPWNLSPSEAVALQKKLAGEVERTDCLGEVRHIAGIDVGFEYEGRVARAAVAVLRADTLVTVDQCVARRETRFPYITGLLSFREIPAILDALDKLTIQPDLLLMDGQGIAHPRRVGIASHLGLVTGMPSIGVGKSRLTGRHAEPPAEKGGWTPLLSRGETIGAVLRTRPGCRPLYISTGHRVSLETAIAWVLRATTRYRLPETTRAAHRLASGPR